MLKIKHQKEDPFVPPISISALFNLSCFLHNKNVAIDQNEFRITRKQIKHDKKILVRALLALGIKKGDIITVATGRPIYECILLFLSANQIGAIITFVDEKSTRTQILQFLEDYNSPLLVTYQKSASKIKELKKEAKSVKNVINLEGTTSIDGMRVGKISVSKIAERFKGHVPKNTFSANNLALITYTSGSTSGPKPVLFTNKSLVAGAIFNKTASGVKMWDKNIHTWMQFVKFNYPY
jgi:acyl-coenzyme A synthetase/AMP-(fatty) acid ligase